MWEKWAVFFPLEKPSDIRRWGIKGGSALIDTRSCGIVIEKKIERLDQEAKN
ncbi:MAG: hypothetical protein ACE5PM_06585 [Candidatus Hydrothermarchaeales archaeon]